MDIAGVNDIIKAFKGALDAFKSARDLIPAGEKREELQAKLIAAEKSLRRSDALLARQLGYHLCQCTFPGTPMLWRENEKAHVCTVEGCGRRIEKSTANQVRMGDSRHWLGR